MLDALSIVVELVFFCLRKGVGTTIQAGIAKTLLPNCGLGQIDTLVTDRRPPSSFLTRPAKLNDYCTIGQGQPARYGIALVI